MRIKHYLLILLTMTVIAFMQALVVFLGNLMVIGGVLAYIYADLPPAVQDDYERRVGQALGQVRDFLRRKQQQPAVVYRSGNGGRLRWLRISRTRVVERD